LLTSARRGRVICEAKRIWSHYFVVQVRNAFRALHCGLGKWQGFSLHYQLMRLCGFAEQIARARAGTLAPGPTGQAHGFFSILLEARHRAA
jgi:hypothetical protein